MQKHFFGQYLIDKGVISEAQFFAAMQLQHSGNVLLGQLALELNMLDTKQIKDINQQQATQNKCFGELAKGLGLLSDEQLQTLLLIQEHRNRRIGEVLVSEGILNPENLAKHLFLYKLDCHSALQHLQSGIAHHPLKKTLNSAIEVCNALFLRLLQARCHVKNLIDDYAQQASYAHTSHIIINGQSSFKIALACDDDTLINIACVFIEMEAKEMTIKLALDVLGEFLNILVGQLLEALIGEGGESERSVPSLVESASQLIKNSEDFLAVDMLSQLGGFVLIVTNPPPKS